MLRILFFISFILFLNNSRAQSLAEELSFDKLAVYDFSYQKDSLNSENVRQEKMFLFLTDTSSLFVSKVFFFRDSAHFEDIKDGKTSRFEIVGGTIVISHTSYYIHKKADMINTYDAIHSLGAKINREIVKVTERSDAFKWEIFEETKTIAGMSCQKASVNYGGRNWIAWFTTDIPISDGPYKFGGLPGLIIEMYDSQEFFRFSLANLTEQDRSVTINFRPDLVMTKMDTREFFQNRKDYQENMFELWMLKQDMNTEDSERAKERAKEINRTNNNWMERYP
ncbi:MAG: GLPGLI family protein [Sphingobacterium sp.]